MALQYVFTGFENASPVNWETREDGTVVIDLIYDHERESPNRAVLHWHIQLQADPGTKLHLVLRNFDNIWNGRPGSPLRERTSCCVSADGSSWRLVAGKKQPDNTLAIDVTVPDGTLFLARIEPYRLSDLDGFFSRIAGEPTVSTASIGRTVEGRQLEILRVGDPGNLNRVFLRARAHPWETGGNWLLEGLVGRLLDELAAGAAPYCLYAMPMANKDGVVRGGSRFNLQGKDLNRDWDRPADPLVAPENHALEQWLKRMADCGEAPGLAIDLHNDGGGQLHVSRPESDAEAYLGRMARFEQCLRTHTFFTEGSTNPNFRNPGSFGEGLYERFGVTACILELNCNWNAGLGKPPLGADWQLMGKQMHDAFIAYFSCV